MRLAASTGTSASPAATEQLMNGTIDLDPPWKERKKQIFPHAFARTINPEVDPDGAYKEMNTLLRQLATEFQEAVKAGHEGCGGTIVLDGGTMLNNYLTARAQKEGPEMRAKGIFGSPFTSRNNFWKALMDLAKGCNRNFIAIHHAAEVWGDKGPTGELIAGGDKLVEADVDVIIQTLRAPGEIARDSKGKPVIGPHGKAKMDVSFGLFVRDCRGNSSLREVELPWLTYDDFVALVQG